MRVSHVLCGKVSTFPRQHYATWRHTHLPNTLAQPPTMTTDRRHEHLASHVLVDHGYVPALALHSALLWQKLPSSFYPHDVHHSRPPRGGLPTAELLQSLAPCPRTVWHPPRSNQVQPRGSQSQVAISTICGHKPCTGGEYATYMQSPQSPSELHHTWYTQKRPAETPSTDFPQQLSHTHQSPHALQPPQATHAHCVLQMNQPG